MIDFYGQIMWPVALGKISKYHIIIIPKIFFILLTGYFVFTTKARTFLEISLHLNEFHSVFQVLSQLLYYFTTLSDN